MNNLPEDVSANDQNIIGLAVYPILPYSIYKFTSISHGLNEVRENHASKNFDTPNLGFRYRFPIEPVEAAHSHVLRSPVF